MVQRRTLYVLLICLAAAWGVGAREWTDNTGKFKIEAEYAELSGGTVHLKKPDGTITQVPLERLSPADQAYVQDRSRAPEEPPSPASAVPSDTSSAQDPFAVTAESVAHDAVTKMLNEVQGKSPPEAVAEADRLRQQIPRVSGEPRMVLNLALAVALQRANQPAAARAALEELLAKSGGAEPAAGNHPGDATQNACEPYAVTARSQLQLMERTDPQGLEKYYQQVGSGKAGEAAGKPDAQSPSPSAELNPEGREGWFLIRGVWQFTRERRAAWEVLLELRVDRLSVRLFQYLRALAPSSPANSYLFVLLMLTAGFRLLALPLSFHAAKMAVQMRALIPAMQTLSQIYANDPLGLQRELNRLYLSRGINPMRGCLSALVNVIFVIWALWTLSEFAPQLRLDGAKFFAFGDVTQFSAEIVFAFAALNIVLVSMNPFAGPYRNPLALGCGGVASGALCWLIAWYWIWPAYVFIFWGMLSVVDFLLLRAFILLHAQNAD